MGCQPIDGALVEFSSNKGGLPCSRGGNAPPEGPAGNGGGPEAVGKTSRFAGTENDQIEGYKLGVDGPRVGPKVRPRTGFRRIGKETGFGHR